MLPAKRQIKTIKVKQVVLEFDSHKPDHVAEKEIREMVDQINDVLQKHLVGPLPQLTLDEKQLSFDITPFSEMDEED